MRKVMRQDDIILVKRFVIKCLYSFEAAASPPPIPRRLDLSLVPSPFPLLASLNPSLSYLGDLTHTAHSLSLMRVYVSMQICTILLL